MTRPTKVSIVIPTYNRAQNLGNLLGSILEQTVRPDEVIIVDDSESGKTETMVRSIHNDFASKATKLVYNHSGDVKGRSTARARNMGAAEATGDIIFFIDDDVVLDRDYLKEILAVYARHDNALGVMAQIGPGRARALVSNANWLFSNAVHRVFFMNYVESEGERMLPSGGVTWPYNLKGDAEAQWFSGTNMSFRRKIIEEFRFDERLKKYALFEDVDFSYRVYKSYSGSLYITTRAKLIHTPSPIARIESENYVYKQNINRAYFFQKNIEQTLLNRMIFGWNALGNLLIALLAAFKKPALLVQVKVELKAKSTILKHWKELRTEPSCFEE